MRRPSTVLVALLVIAGAVCALGVLLGHLALSADQTTGFVIGLRVARVAVAFLAGAGLAVGGVFVQGLFRNPLASPSILGTTAGATLGGQITLMLSKVLVTGSLAAYIAPEMFQALGCIVGALLSLLLLLAVAGRRRDLIMLLLTGFILSSLFLSVGSFLLALSQDEWNLGRAVVAFALGGVRDDGLRHVAVAAPLVLIGILSTWLWRGPLDVLLSGEKEARSLGVDVAAVRRWAIVWTAILTAGAVAVGGNVGFVGLVVPHVMRPLVGVQHRLLVPAAGLAGGSFLVACDIIGRILGDKIPLGVVTGLIGAPVFLGMLVRAHNRGVHG